MVLRRAGVRGVKRFVFVYSVHVPFMVHGLLLARLSGARLIGVWTDPPAVDLLTDGRILPLMRKIELQLARALMRRFEFVVSVTKDLAEDWAPEASKLVLDGFADDTVRALPVYRDPGPTRVTYTGTLDRRYGIDRLLEGVLLVPEAKGLSLCVYGAGDYQEAVRKIAESDSRILYGGRVSHDEALLRQSQSDFLINVRDPDEDFTQYSFPSKTLEYLSSAVPVISTRITGLTDEFTETMIILEDNSPQAIAAALTKACALGANQRQSLGSGGSKVAKSRSVRAQGLRIADFVGK